MNFTSRLKSGALELAQKHRELFDRLPVTFLVSHLVELEKWPDWFEAERAFFRALFDYLAELPADEFDSLFTSLESFERRAGCGAIRGRHAEELQSRLLAHLRTQGLYPEWRFEIETIVQELQPKVEERLHGANPVPRAVLVLYGRGIAIERAKLWKRLRARGVPIALDLRGNEPSPAFLRTLLTGRSPGEESPQPPSIFRLLHETSASSPEASWVIEAGDDLHRLLEEEGGELGGSETGVTALSFARLRPYRERLSETIFTSVSNRQMRSPQELASFLKTLRVKPREGVSLYSDEIVLNFARDIFLSGSGTLLINNTFVEWASLQALKRVQPRLLVARFGVRDKMKPFSSLLLFSKPRQTDQIPILEDPFGSFTDVELLSYYIWLNAESRLPYRGRTLHVFLAEGVDEALVLSPRVPAPREVPTASATLADVAVTVAAWLGADLPSSGRVLEEFIT